MQVSEQGPTFLFNTSYLNSARRQDFNHTLKWKPITGGEKSRFAGGGQTLSSTLGNEFSWTLMGEIDYFYDPDHVQEMLDIAIQHHVPALRMPELVVNEFGILQLGLVLGKLLEQSKSVGESVQGTTNFAVRTGMFPRHYVIEKDGQLISCVMGDPTAINKDDSGSPALDPGDVDFQSCLRGLFHFFHSNQMLVK